MAGSESKPKSLPTSSFSAASTPRSSSARGPRTPRKVGVQATRLEAIDHTLGPLGPLGENFNPSEPELPPAPPTKEQTLPTRHARLLPSPQPSTSRGMVDSAEPIDDDRNSAASRQRYSQQGISAPGGTENSRRPTQPSVSIEQAARPNFDITVGDPHKVGDLTSSHIVYQVRTKVCAGHHGQSRGTYPDFHRHPPKRISSPSSRSADVIATSYGSTIRCTTTTPELWSHHHQKSKPLVALIAIL